MAAVLFLVFNRPDLTKQVFDSIRAYKPARLYVAADGPRAHKEGEAALCEQVRSIVKQVDWPCELYTLFREHNLGCKRAIMSGITWFFEHEEEGIILEDDCLPHPGFYRFCSSMLAHYRKDERIGHICGTNFIEAADGVPYSHYLVPYAHNWGWASWRRVWKKFLEIELNDETIKPDKIPGNWSNKIYWVSKVKEANSGKVDTWDYQTQYMHWYLGHKAVLPIKNLISNIGFDARATHTTRADQLLQNRRTQAFDFDDLRVASEAENKAIEQRIYQTIFRRSSLAQAKRAIKYLFKL
jgi:hypothetical protein